MSTSARNLKPNPGQVLPFCFIYGTTGVLLAVSFGDLRAEPVYLFFACMMAATVMEWITAKLLERLPPHRGWQTFRPGWSRLPSQPPSPERNILDK